MDSVLEPITSRRKRTRPTNTASNSAPPEKVDLSKGEETCLALLVRYPQLRSQGLELDAELFVGTENRQVFQAWRETAPDGDIGTMLVEELRPHLERIVGKNLPPYDPAQVEKAFLTCTERLKRSKMRVARAVSALEIAEKEQKLGAGPLIERARQLMEGEALPQDLPEDETDDARIVVRDMEAGLELHEKK